MEQCIGGRESRQGEEGDEGGAGKRGGPFPHLPRWVPWLGQMPFCSNLPPLWTQQQVRLKCTSGVSNPVGGITTVGHGPSEGQGPQPPT